MLLSRGFFLQTNKLQTLNDFAKVTLRYVCKLFYFLQFETLVYFSNLYYFIQPTFWLSFLFISCL